MDSLSIVMTTWLNLPDRFGYLRQVVEALRRNLRIPARDDDQSLLRDWIVAAEFNERDATLDGEFTDYCDQHGLRIVWNRDGPDLGNNLNLMISEVETELLLYVQDDWILHRVLNIEPDMTMLRRGIDFVQYWWCPDKPEALGPPQQHEGVNYHHIQPVHQTWYYRDNPFLARRDAFDKLGPFLSCDGAAWRAERHMANHAKSIVRIVGRGNEPDNKDEFFRHIGHESTRSAKWKAGHLST